MPDMLATPTRRAIQRYLMWWDRLWLRLFRRSVGGYIGKAPVLVLHSTGRRSGRSYAVPLCYLPDGDAMLIGGGSGGSQRHPGWYHNLRATPETTVKIDGEVLPVTAELLTDDARTDAWRKLNAAMPLGVKYEQQLAREIPVFRLRPRD
jgi:deazaflavin-dependent oxidoreductase (nitroreductase family)